MIKWLTLIVLKLVVHCAYSQTHSEFKNRISQLLDGEEINIDEAVLYLDSVLTVEPDCVPCFWYKARIAAHTGNFKEALSHLSTLFTFNMQTYNYDGYVLQGEIYEQQKAFQKALKSYEEALKIRPKATQMLSRQGRIFHQAFNDPKGKTLIIQAHQLQPNDPVCLFNFCEILLEQGDYEQLVVEGRPLLLDPHFKALTTYFFAKSYTFLKAYDSAMLYFNQVKTFGEPFLTEADEMIALIKKQEQYNKNEKPKQPAARVPETVNRNLHQYSSITRPLTVLKMKYAPLKKLPENQENRYLISLTTIRSYIDPYSYDYELHLANGDVMNLHNGHHSDLIRLKHKDLNKIILSARVEQGTFMIDFVVSEATLQLILQHQILKLKVYQDRIFRIVEQPLEVTPGLEWEHEE